MPVLWSLCRSPSSRFACDVLKENGWEIREGITRDSRTILLDIPSKPEAPLSLLPEGAAVYGGKLGELAGDRFRKIDLLNDPEFAARNGEITARCALRLVCGQLEETLLSLPVLVIGWGRIGKCLIKLLTALGADCAVYARKPEDRAILKALGYRSITRDELLGTISSWRVILNTAPAPVLSGEDTKSCQDCLLVDLASVPGIENPNVISARGLPGKMAPKAAGTLIAQTVIRLWKEETI